LQNSVTFTGFILTRKKYKYKYGFLYFFLLDLHLDYIID
jgi:hypothetical protein